MAERLKQGLIAVANLSWGKWLLAAIKFVIGVLLATLLTLIIDYWLKKLGYEGYISKQLPVILSLLRRF